MAILFRWGLNLCIQIFWAWLWISGITLCVSDHITWRQTVHKIVQLNMGTQWLMPLRRIILTLKMFILFDRTLVFNLIWLIKTKHLFEQVIILFMPVRHFINIFFYHSSIWTSLVYGACLRERLLTRTVIV